MIHTRTERDHVVIPCAPVVWGNYLTVWSTEVSDFISPVSGIVNYTMTHEEAESLATELNMGDVYACVASVNSLMSYASL